MDLIKINPNRSFISLRNTGATDVGIRAFDTTNAKPGQIVVVTKENTRTSGDGTGNIYLVSIADPVNDASGPLTGNISLPKNLPDATILASTPSYDQLQLKNDQTVDSTGGLATIIKTFVTLIYDGWTWNVISTVDNATYYRL